MSFGHLLYCMLGSCTSRTKTSYKARCTLVLVRDVRDPIIQYWLCTVDLIEPPCRLLSIVSPGTDPVGWTNLFTSTMVTNCRINKPENLSLSLARFYWQNSTSNIASLAQRQCQMLIISVKMF